jgi:hypothetical protein
MPGGASPFLNQPRGFRWDRPMDAQSPISRWGMNKRDSTGLFSVFTLLTVFFWIVAIHSTQYLILCEGNEPRTHHGHVDFGDQTLQYSYGVDRCLHLDQVFSNIQDSFSVD